MFCLVLCVVLQLVIFPMTPNGDMMMKTHTIVTERSQEREASHYVYYRSGVMRRRDRLDSDGQPSVSTIANCKTKIGFLVDLKAQQYRTFKLPEFLSNAQIGGYAKEHPDKAVAIESRTVDTGETKIFFGYRAKHLVTTLKLAPNKSGRSGEELIDGWYIEHERPDENCAPIYTANQLSYLLPTGLVEYPEVPHFHHSGPLPKGLAVKSIHTIKLPNNGNNAVGEAFATNEAVEVLDDSPVRPSYFEIPTGYRENPDLFRK